ncbi:MAG: FecR domain-containing protein [Armatimonadota bacterium]
MSRQTRKPCAVLITFLLVVTATAAAAQQAKFTAVSGVVAKQAAGSTQWARCKVGTTLRAGDRASTGKRSTAQIDFADGSYVRLGERTDVVLRSAAKVDLQVSRGRVYGKFAKGSTGAIGGRSAVAAVKGTVMEFLAEGEVEAVRCHQGEVLLAQAGPLTRTGTADGGATDSLVDDALQVDPDDYWNGGTLTITQGTNAGEARAVVDFDGTTGTVTADTPFPAPIDATSQYILSLEPPEEALTLRAGEEARTKPGQAPGTPFPTAPEEFAGGEEDPFFRDVRPGDTRVFPGTGGQEDFQDATVTVGDVVNDALGGQEKKGSLKVVVSSTGPRASRPGAAGLRPRIGPGVRVQGPRSSGDRDSLGALAVPLLAAAPLSLLGGGAFEGAAGQLQPQRRDEWLLNERAGVELFGFWGEGGGSSGGVRVRPSGVLKNLYFEFGAQQRSLFDGQDLTDITAAYVTARGGWGDLRAGRQRFLMGPVVNSNVGTLLAFDTADAVRYTSNLHNGTTFDVAYLWDTTPFRGDPDFGGLYGRVTMQNDDGVFGLNLLTMEGSAGNFGASVDAAVPVVRGCLDLYWEVGEDPFGRFLWTGGTYFPKLYQHHDIDLFLEYAHRDGIPNLASARVYKTFSERWIGIVQVQRSDAGDTRVGAGALFRFDIK